MKEIKWKKYWEKVKGQQPKDLVQTIIKIDDELYINVHTDINIYDFGEKRAWKGDLV